MPRLVRRGRKLAVSVIVITRNRASYLDLTPPMLERQVVPAREWEVIVADERSVDSTSEVVNHYRRGRLQVRSS